MTNRIGDLELAQDLTHQRREWRIERIGWVVWALLLVAAAVGLLGPGAASQTVAGDEGGALWAEYDGLVRHRAPTELLLHLDPASAREGVVRLQLDQDYLDHVAIEDIVPKPDQEEATADHIVYSFAVAQTDQPLLITFRLQPDSMGPLSTAIAIEGGARVDVRQFVYP